MYFFCIACFRPSRANKNSLGREGTNCYWCNGTARDRAMLLSIHIAFIKKLLRKPRYLPQIIGVSDGYLMETILKKIYRSNYQNYQYHIEPILDITQVPWELHGSADIISCSEVLEHVAPPIDLAFSGLSNLLNSGGTLILSVPHSDASGDHVEHFPVMKTFEVDLVDTPRLKGILIGGEEVEFNNLVFHGGIGATLEYRIFSQASLDKYLKLSGFKSSQVIDNKKFLGILWEPWSRVWVCKKTK
jgi:hypothetical protein